MDVWVGLAADTFWGGSHGQKGEGGRKRVDSSGLFVRIEATWYQHGKKMTKNRGAGGGDQNYTHSGMQHKIKKRTENRWREGVLWFLGQRG